MIAVVASELTGRPYDRSVVQNGGWETVLFRTATIQYQPPGLDILPMYVVFLALSPIVLTALRRGLTQYVLLASVSLYACAQFSPGLFRVLHSSYGDETFRLPAWQILFFGGMCAGYHRDAIHQFVLTTKVWKSLLIGSAFIFTSIFILEIGRAHV